MRILLSNDDGIRAPGIVALYSALAGETDDFPGPVAAPGIDGPTRIIPIAPLTVQSATSHGVTFSEPLMIARVDVTETMHGIAVDGRPADCVKLALSQLWPEIFGKGTQPDLLISGMNMGANCGINVIYSGTVAAALEGAFLGIPSIAVSLHLGEVSTPDYDRAAKYARRAIEAIIAKGLPDRHACININIPITNVGEPDAMPPIRVCPMNTHGLIDRYDRRISPAGQTYFWSSSQGLDFHATENGSDVQVLYDRTITVTPLAYDLTDHNVLDYWSRRLAT